jgi:hypothetical protein
MADCSKNTNPLLRSGMNRAGRKLPGLDPNYALPDENKMEDWMAYARDLAGFIRFYNAENKCVDKANWQAFFESDVSAPLALISVQNIQLYKESIRSLFESIQSEEFKSDAVQLKKKFGLLYSAIFSLAFRMDYFHGLLPDEIPLKRNISNLIQVKLAPAFRRLLGYYKAADAFYSPKLINETLLSDWVILAYPQLKASEVIGVGLSDKWWYKLSESEVIIDWNDYYTNIIKADTTIYQHTAAVVADTDVWQVLNHAVNHNLFSSIFAEFLAALARIIAEAKKQLYSTITEQNSHEPHYALFLTFLHLFKHAQTGINTYSKKHLDFYYKEILQLVPKKWAPNHVHLCLELANTSNEYLLKAGTAFKAGKDSLGKEVVYTSDEDVVLNKAEVTQLCSFYRAGSSDKITGISQQGNLYASPVANSADGAGAKLTTPEKDWHPFANKLYTDGNLSSLAMPMSTIGFGFSSHYFFLKEGKRTVTITLNGTSLNKLSAKQFDVFLSTEKNWLQKAVSISAVTSSHATFTVVIDPVDPPVTAYNVKVHLDNFQATDTPVIKFLLKNITGNDQYEDLKDVFISSADIQVNVGTLNDQTFPDGLKELLVSTDFGTVDPSKPFLPFGQNPKKGAGLVIGNKELFSKPNTKFKLFIEWAELIETIQDMDVNTINEFFPSAQLKFLQSGVWKNGQFKSILNNQNKGQDEGEVELFWGASSIMMANVHLPSAAQFIPADAVSDYKNDPATYTISSQNGFFKLELNADFQWDDYYFKLQKHLIALATPATADDTANPLPAKPYLPKIQSLFLTYESSTTIDFSADDKATCFHLYPFGTTALSSKNLEAGKVKLMPQFAYTDPDPLIGKVHAQAEFYIGLQKVVPAQKVNLLFKVLDGSTDPLQKKPDNHIFWSYLSNNSWIDFDKNQVNDTTQQLLSTGIISFPIPEEATNNNTLMPAGFHWIKAGISQLPEEVSRLIDVKAQAIQATFFDQGNASDFISQPLAAGTISKLKESDPQVKKVDQPYASFGGRYQESTGDYYIRVSERLRHKNRAITIRDIEQLVLENFKEIHKVKCLNHTRFDLDVSPTIYNELSPGHVTVITIPDLNKKNAINPLRPYTDRSTLNHIKSFLLGRANCNMRWYVENPQFEEVRIDVDVVLTAKAAGNDSFYTEQVKQDLVKYFTPWAYNINKEINFGGKINKSSIINFIEELDYIDVILDLKMFHNKQDGSPESSDQDEILAATAKSILVSAPASKHHVHISKLIVKAETGDCK